MKNINKRINVTLTGDQYKLIRDLAKKDRVSVQEEMQMIFFTELTALEDYSRELLADPVENVKNKRHVIKL